MPIYEVPAFVTVQARSKKEAIDRATTLLQTVDAEAVFENPVDFCVQVETDPDQVTRAEAQ